MNPALLKLLLKRNLNRLYMEESAQTNYLPMTTEDSLKSSFILIATTPESALKITNLKRSLNDLEPLEPEVGLKLFKNVSEENPRIDIANSWSKAEYRAFSRLQSSETLGIQIPEQELTKNKTGTLTPRQTAHIAKVLDPANFRNKLKVWPGPELNGA